MCFCVLMCVCSRVLLHVMIYIISSMCDRAQARLMCIHHVSVCVSVCVLGRSGQLTLVRSPSVLSLIL